MRGIEVGVGRPAGHDTPCETEGVVARALVLEVTRRPDRTLAVAAAMQCVVTEPGSGEDLVDQRDVHRRSVVRCAGHRQVPIGEPEVIQHPRCHCARSLERLGRRSHEHRMFRFISAR